jgi:ferredoxin/flavodoxin---NADP+ reductase
MNSTVINTESTVVTSQNEIRKRSDHATVTAVKHWSDRLFSFKVERPDTLRFRSGEFVMLGLMDEAEDGKQQRPILRAYSIASPSWDEELEFYSIKVPDGPLTSKLQHLKPGDSIILRPKPVGTLVLDALLPGKRLWMLATGTGIAPFASLIRDPDVYEKYDEVILMHTCRKKIELDYGKTLVEDLLSHEFLSEIVEGKFTYHPSTTQEASGNQGRITQAIESGSVFEDLDLTPLSVESDRLMMCGSLEFNLDMQKILDGKGFKEGSNSQPGSYVIEKAFVD